MPAKIICLLFYAAALLSLFVEMPATVEQILQYGTLALFAAHAVEIAVALRYIKLYEGPLLISMPVSYTHLRAHETVLDLVCRLLLEKKTISQAKGIPAIITHQKSHTHHKRRIPQPYLRNQ